MIIHCGRFIYLQLENDSWIIVMEYCAGGSLYSKLCEPEYMHGLPEEELLNLLRDLSKAQGVLPQDCTMGKCRPGVKRLGNNL